MNKRSFGHLIWGSGNIPTPADALLKGQSHLGSDALAALDTSVRYIFMGANTIRPYIIALFCPKLRSKRLHPYSQKPSPVIFSERLPTIRQLSRFFHFQIEGRQTSKFIGAEASRTPAQVPGRTPGYTKGGAERTLKIKFYFSGLPDIPSA